jgi:hypothetical protein
VERAVLVESVVPLEQADEMVRAEQEEQVQRRARYMPAVRLVIIHLQTFVIVFCILLITSL